MNIPRIENMTSSRGNTIPNQFKIYTDDGVFFQSYDTIIAFRPYAGQIQLDTDWNYSVTTGKYRNQFLNETINDTRRKIADGTYIVTNLNR